MLSLDTRITITAFSEIPGDPCTNSKIDSGSSLKFASLIFLQESVFLLYSSVVNMGSTEVMSMVGGGELSSPC